jgi:NDP-sugar pyrophosphorylase family protein
MGVIHGNPLLPLHGDSLLEVDLQGMLAAPLASGASATVALTPVAAPERYGTVCLDPNGEIRAFAEKKAAT